MTMGILHQSGWAQLCCVTKNHPISVLMTKDAIIHILCPSHTSRGCSSLSLRDPCVQKPSSEMLLGEMTARKHVCRILHGQDGALQTCKWPLPPPPVSSLTQPMTRRVVLPSQEGPQAEAVMPEQDQSLPWAWAHHSDPPCFLSLNRVLSSPRGA